jgi:hypothetical protein
MPYSDERTQERLRSALAVQLMDRGCPAERASELVAELRHGRWSVSPVSEPHDVQGWLEWRNMSVLLDDPNAPDDVAYAIDSVVENVAAENAEAWDRIARGESDVASDWPLPERRPRR